jgi:hypothetical protein
MHLSDTADLLWSVPNVNSICPLQDNAVPIDGAPGTFRTGCAARAVAPHPVDMQVERTVGTPLYAKPHLIQTINQVDEDDDACKIVHHRPITKVHSSSQEVYSAHPSIRQDWMYHELEM